MFDPLPALAALASQVRVDWDRAAANDPDEHQLRRSNVLRLVEALVQSVAVWYNVSGTRRKNVQTRRRPTVFVLSGIQNTHKEIQIG